MVSRLMVLIILECREISSHFVVPLDLHNVLGQLHFKIRQNKEKQNQELSCLETCLGGRILSCQ